MAGEQRAALEFEQAVGDLEDAGEAVGVGQAEVEPGGGGAEGGAEEGEVAGPVGAGAVGEVVGLAERWRGEVEASIMAWATLST